MATPTPPAGGTPSTTSLGDPLLDQGVKVLKDLFKVELDLGTFAGLTDPGIDKLAKSAAVATKKWLKPGNPLLHPLMNYGLGMLSGRIDKAADNQPEPLKTLMRKVSDFLDSYRGELFGRDALEHGPEVSEKTKESFSKIQDAFWARALELIASTHATDMEIVVNQLKAEAYGLVDVKDALAHGRPKESEPGVPLGERLRSGFNTAVKAADKGLGDFNAELTPAVNWLKKDAERLCKEREAKAKRSSESVIGKILDAPWKLMAKLWA